MHNIIIMCKELFIEVQCSTYNNIKSPGTCSMNNIGEKCAVDLLEYLTDSYLYQRGKNIVIEADRVPEALQGNNCINN